MPSVNVVVGFDCSSECNFNADPCFISGSSTHHQGLVLVETNYLSSTSIWGKIKSKIEYLCFFESVQLFASFSLSDGTSTAFGERIKKQQQFLLIHSCHGCLCILDIFYLHNIYSMVTHLRVFLTFHA